MSSQSPSAQLMPLAPTLTLYGTTGKPIGPDDKQTALRRREKVRLDLLAIQYSEEALLALVTTMRQTKDERLRRDCANDILNRGLGRTKPTTEDGQKAGTDAQGLLELLAASSINNLAREQAQRTLGHTKTEPKDVTPDVIEHDAEAFLRDLENDHD